MHDFSKIEVKNSLELMLVRIVVGTYVALALFSNALKCFKTGIVLNTICPLQIFGERSP